MDTTLIRQLFSLPDTYPGINEIPSNCVYLLNCGQFDQFCCTARAILSPEKFCPFCQTEMERRSRKPLAGTGNWLLIENEFPRKDAHRMLLIVPVHHTERPDFDGHDWAQIGDLFRVCRESYDIPNGGFLMRFGDPRFHAGTVPHCHINVVRPIPGVKYRPPFSKDESDYAGDYTERLLEFRKMLSQRGGLEWLLSDEGIQETQPKLAA